MLKESITTDAQLNDFQEANMADLNANCTVNLRPVKSPHFRYQDGFTGDFLLSLCMTLTSIFLLTLRI